MFKQLTLLGYFSSEIGHKQALRYNQAPGRYEGDVPYKKGIVPGLKITNLRI
ncbi:gluconate 2-dehydrogenase subunit 3 family protein [Sphingobacterium sp. E70]|uniref:gluconate 2-dehydrogenase subunit 3 family protein n=1 Tax=Sphingobacterium sp. E70 TaxID=2853439 RepID=UPI00211CB1FE|nr:gluconate 2-dehydrogenase subunit 3 family protein [Sphingobacterium sp. E70]